MPLAVASIKIAELRIGTAITGLRVENHIAAIIDVSGFGAPRLVPPESLFMFAIPVVINKSWSWSDDHSYQKTRFLIIREAIVSMVHPVR